MIDENVLALALKSISCTDGQRDAVKAGSYAINSRVLVDGILTVNENHTATVTAKIPWQRIAAILLDKVNGVTLESVVREAMEGKADEKKIGKRAAEAMARIKAPAKANRRGAVSFDGEAFLITKK